MFTQDAIKYKESGESIVKGSEVIRGPRVQGHRVRDHVPLMTTGCKILHETPANLILSDA